MHITAPELDITSLTATDRIKLRTFTTELKNGNLEAVDSSRDTYAKRFAGTPLAAYAFYAACVNGGRLTAIALLRADAALNPDEPTNEEGLSALAYAKLQPAFRGVVGEMQQRADACNAAAAMAQPIAPEPETEAPITTDIAPAFELPQASGSSIVAGARLRGLSGALDRVRGTAAPAEDRVAIQGATSAAAPAIDLDRNNGEARAAFLKQMNDGQGRS